MKELMNRYVNLVNDHLPEVCDRILPTQLPYPEGVMRACQVNSAARYSLLDGGKRIRGVLVLAACELLGGRAEDALDFAAAVEMLHCYSLIHDDLPCMDNDDFRRGKPSCHKAFGEATALLAGDALQGSAFEAIATAKTQNGQPMSAKAIARAAAALALGGGARGMVFGQEIDLAYENNPNTEEILRCIHRHKTGHLINAAVQMGAAAADGSAHDGEILEHFAFDLGLVFQIVDDVLDVTATAEELGKPIGSDAENGKTTYITLYGAEGAMKLAREINENSCRKLREEYGEKSEFLVWLAESLLKRRS